MSNHIGTDIICHSRLAYLKKNPQDSFVRHAFTAKEQEIGSRVNDVVVYYCGLFAAKEAVWKAVSFAVPDFRYDQIETVFLADGRPQVNLYGETKNLVAKAGITDIQLSLSHEDGITIAVALAN